MKKLINELAPCGVFCGACPSFNKTCFGCASDYNGKARSKSRFGCKIRICCYDIQKVNYCAECEQFPCSKVKNKLLNSHTENPRYKYRHELERIILEFRKMGPDDFLQFQRKRWTCPSCGGVVHFYHYKCSKCGKHVDVCFSG